jgi:hypothetical protein
MSSTRGRARGPRKKTRKQRYHIPTISDWTAASYDRELPKIPHLSELGQEVKQLHDDPLLNDVMHPFTTNALPSSNGSTVTSSRSSHNPTHSRPQRDSTLVVALVQVTLYNHHHVTLHNHNGFQSILPTMKTTTL